MVVQVRGSLEAKGIEVDLTTGDIVEKSAREHNERLLGGRGLNHWLLLKGMKQSADCFSPENLLLIGTGSLVGTDVPGANRVQIASRNCFNNGIGSASAGGDFAPQLRFAGYDYIRVTGRAKEPVFLWIDDERIELRSAQKIWGKTTGETDDLLKAELGDPDLQTLRIGPAGENLVRAACIIVSEGRAAGRCGVGAVMGSKNLKAIAVRVTKEIQLARKIEFTQLLQQILDRFEKYDVIKRERKQGTTAVTFKPPYRLLPGRNFQNPAWKGKLKQQDFDKYIVDSRGCFSCPVRCCHSFEISDGIYGGTKIKKMEANSIWDFGPRLGIDTSETIIKAHELCQQYGLDIDNTSGVIAWAFECYQKGILSKADAEDMELMWGDGKAVISLIEKIAYRRGLGGLLAEGCKKASEKFGKGSEEFCIHIKGQDLFENMRDARGWALGVAVSERAGGHTRGAPLVEYNKGLVPEVMQEVFGFPFATDEISSEGKARLVVYYERFHAILDSLGVCYLASNWTTDLDLPGPRDFAQLFSAATGLELSPDDLMAIGEEIHTIGKVFNTIHAGFTRHDDYPPRRMMEEPVDSGYYKGEVLSSDEWGRMLDEYYELHGWDKNTGWATERTLKSLGFEESITKELENMGRLPH